MRLHRIIIIALVLVALVLVGWLVWRYLQTSNRSIPTTTSVAPQMAPHGLEQVVPSATASLTVLRNPYFTVVWDTQNQVPRWAWYPLSKTIAERGPSPDRPSRFADDPAIDGEPLHEAYTGTKMDRGHLVPSYAMWSRHGRDGMMATYLTTNIVPEYPRFNQGVWQNLEEIIAGRPDKPKTENDEHRAGITETLGDAVVVVMPIYGSHGYDKANKLRIPQSVACVVASGSGVWGFMIPNRPEVTNGDPLTYQVPLGSIEASTGIDLPSTTGPDDPLAAVPTPIPAIFQVLK